LVDTIHNIQKLVTNQMEEAQLTQQQQYNKKHDDKTVFWAGEQVWLWKLGLHNSKWDAHWKGPYHVKDHINEHLYTLIGKKDQVTNPINVNILKLYHSRETIPPTLNEATDTTEEVEPMGEDFESAWLNNQEVVCQKEGDQAQPCTQPRTQQQVTQDAPSSLITAKRLKESEATCEPQTKKRKSEGLSDEGDQEDERDEWDNVSSITTRHFESIVITNKSCQ